MPAAEEIGAGPNGEPAIKLMNDVWHTARMSTQCNGRGRVNLCGMTSLQLSIRASAAALAAGAIFPTITVSTYGVSESLVSLINDLFLPLERVTR